MAGSVGRAFRRGIALLASLRTAAAFFWPVGWLWTEPARPAELDESACQQGELQAWRRAVRWFVPSGLGVGLVWVGIFIVCKKQFWQAEALHVVPALAVAVIDSLFLSHRLWVGLALSAEAAVEPTRLRGASERDADRMGATGTLVLILAVTVTVGCLMSLPAGRLWWPGHGDPRRYLNWAYPSPIYRPLLLAPLWGRWAVLLAALVGRASTRAGREMHMLSQAVSPARVLAWIVLPWFLTAIYCSRHRNLVTGTIISLIVLAVSYQAAWVWARRGSGQTKDSVLAVGAIAQLTFLIAYLAFTWQIHG